MTNKEIVREFIETVFNRHDLSAVPKYIAEDYIQHNPNVAQGRAGLIDFLENGMLKRFPSFRQEIRHMYADGDVVVVHLLAVADEGKVENVVFDVYRLQDGIIREHWDCVNYLKPEQLPEKDRFF